MTTAYNLSVTTAWLVDKYDTHVLGQVDGVSLEDSRNFLIEAVLDGVRTGEVPAPEATTEWASALVNSTINPIRTQRRASFKKNSEFLKDALRHPDDGIYVGPFLDIAYPLGTPDGRDMAFRWWTEETFNGARIEHYRGATAAAEAARQYDEDVTEWVSIMRHRGVAMVGDCFAPAHAV